MSRDITREIGVKPSCKVVIRRHGIYLNTVENAQGAVKEWFINKQEAINL